MQPIGCALRIDRPIQRLLTEDDVSKAIHGIFVYRRAGSNEKPIGGCNHRRKNEFVRMLVSSQKLFDHIWKIFFCRRKELLLVVPENRRDESLRPTLIVIASALDVSGFRDLRATD